LLFKVPQILKFATNASVEGAVFSLYAMELSSSAITIPYYIRQNVPLVNFMEVFFVAGASSRPYRSACSMRRIAVSAP
jgi:hypothetical protein